MQFIKKIREEIVQLSCYEIAKKLDLPHTSAWTQFENRKESLNAIKLVKLWRLSGLSGNEFMQMIADEVEGNEES